MSLLKFLTVPARAKHSATVIFVHGLGDSGHGWKPVADMFSRDDDLSHVKWVLPHAPTMRVTANMGMEMPSWFDIISFGFKSDEDEDGMLKTVRSLNELITAEVDAGIPADRIVLGGFSQGGAMSILTGLTSERKLGGIACLSGWVPLRHKFEAMAADHAKKASIFWGHGKSDPMVNYSLGTKSAEFLTESVGLPKAPEDGLSTIGLSFNAYDGVQHSTSNEELFDLLAWLKRVLPKPKPENED